MLLLILGFKVSLVNSLLVTIALALVVYRFSWRDAVSMLRSAFDKKLLVNTFLVLVLKEFITYTGALYLLPDMLAKLPKGSLPWAPPLPLRQFRRVEFR